MSAALSRTMMSWHPTPTGTGWGTQFVTNVFCFVATAVMHKYNTVFLQLDKVSSLVSRPPKNLLSSSIWCRVIELG